MFANIARRNNISTNSVNRILDSISKDKYVKNNGKLPTSFGINEFSATKDTISKMTFIKVNQDTHISLILIILDFKTIYIIIFLDIKDLKEIKLNLLHGFI